MIRFQECFQSLLVFFLYPPLQSGDTIWRYNLAIQSGDTIWRYNLAIELRKLLCRHPQVLMVARAHSMWLEASHIPIFDVELRDTARDHALPSIPLRCDLPGVVDVQHRIEDGPLGQAWREGTQVDVIDQGEFQQAN